METIQSQDSLLLDEEESQLTREQKIYFYINVIPIIGAIYGIGRLLILKYNYRYHRSLYPPTPVDFPLQSPSYEIKQTKWRIIKNLLTSFTLAASALLVPLKKREVIFASIATGFTEGIIDTLVDYYLLTKAERSETSLEELVFNILCHTPIIGLIYNWIRLFYAAVIKRNLEMIKATAWGIVINFITTAITLFTVLQFSLKATGSISTASASRISVFSKSAQMRVAEAFVEKGTTAPLITAGKSLAAKEARKFRRKVKRQLRELRYKIDTRVERFGERHPKLRRRINRLLHATTKSK